MRDADDPAEVEDPGLGLSPEDVDAMCGELREQTRSLGEGRWNANPDDVRRSVVKLVLTLVELIRRLLERRSLKRMEAGTLTDDEVERIGLALMRLEETVAEIADHFEIPPEELNLDLGPLGRLL